ncbi:MAG: hypothetical protein IPK22_06820 [Verrucomicrobiaceae bacterium]|nr:hypothetical protein [Verrucomicrobiaceae bacterium]
MSPAHIINHAFEWCVQFLLWLGGLFGMSYEAVNVWIFCVLWPALTIALLFVIFCQRRKIQILLKSQQ